jgi:hypothetical protein
MLIIYQQTLSINGELIKSLPNYKEENYQKPDGESEGFLIPFEQLISHYDDEKYQDEGSFDDSRNIIVARKSKPEWPAHLERNPEEIHAKSAVSIKGEKPLLCHWHHCLKKPGKPCT